MKYLTKENVMLVLVSLLVLAQVREMTGSPKCPEEACAPIKERVRGMARAGQQGPRMAPQKPVWLKRDAGSEWLGREKKRAEGRGKKTEAKDQ